MYNMYMYMYMSLCHATQAEWTLARALNAGVQLATALSHCHVSAIPGYRVIHRDVQPANIGFMAPPAGSPDKAGRLVLFDFGLTCLWKKNPSWYVRSADPLLRSDRARPIP